MLYISDKGIGSGSLYFLKNTKKEKIWYETEETEMGNKSINREMQKWTAVKNHLAYKRVKH